MTDVRVPVLWWRAVGHSHTGYAVECFIDELLEAAGEDPAAAVSPRWNAAGALRAVVESFEAARLRESVR